MRSFIGTVDKSLTAEFLFPIIRGLIWSTGINWLLCKRDERLRIHGLERGFVWVSCRYCRILVFEEGPYSFALFAYEKSSSLPSCGA